MRKVTWILLIMIVIFIPTICFSEEAVVPCVGVAPIITGRAVESNDHRIIAFYNALRNYKDFIQYAAQGSPRQSLRSATNPPRFEICGVRNGIENLPRIELSVDSIEDAIRSAPVGLGMDGWAGTFDFSTPLVGDPDSALDIYIVGFEIVVNDNSIAGPIFNLTHSIGPGRVILKNVRVINARNSGIVVNGNGRFEMDGIVVNGDAKQGSCFLVKSNGALLKGIEATNCGDGVRVEANNVEIREAKVYNNGAGVHVTNGYSGTKVYKSAVYHNTNAPPDQLDLPERRLEGVMIDEAGLVRDLQFYEFVGGEVRMFDPLGVAGVEDETLYIDLPGDSIGGNGGVEFFLTEKQDCNVRDQSWKQACKVLGDDMRFEIRPADFEGARVVRKALPNEYTNKLLVAIYTDDTLGSTVISQQFMLGGGIDPHGNIIRPYVAFVQMPYDIPTIPGAGARGYDGTPLTDPNVEGDDGGSGNEDNNAGGGGSMPQAKSVEASGPGCLPSKAQIVPGESLSTILFGTHLWWIIFVLSFTYGFHLALVRICNRKRRK